MPTSIFIAYLCGSMKRASRRDLQFLLIGPLFFWVPFSDVGRSAPEFDRRSWSRLGEGSWTRVCSYSRNSRCEPCWILESCIRWSSISSGCFELVVDSFGFVGYRTRVAGTDGALGKAGTSPGRSWGRGTLGRLGFRRASAWQICRHLPRIKRGTIARACSIRFHSFSPLDYQWYRGSTRYLCHSLYSLPSSIDNNGIFSTVLSSQRSGSRSLSSWDPRVRAKLIVLIIRFSLHSVGQTGTSKVKCRNSSMSSKISSNYGLWPNRDFEGSLPVDVGISFASSLFGSFLEQSLADSRSLTSFSWSVRCPFNDWWTSLGLIYNVDITMQTNTCLC